MPNTTERDELIAYYQAVIQDIADAKARSWRFLTVLVLITGALISIDAGRFSQLAKGLLVAGHIIAAVSTMFITCNSVSHLEHRRDILDRIYNRWPDVKSIRDPENKRDVRKKDPGDWFFLIIGLVAPVLSVAIVLVYFYCKAGIAL